MTPFDVAMGALIILGSGFAGIAVGDMLHPRIMSDRKLAFVFMMALYYLVVAITKNLVMNRRKFS